MCARLNNSIFLPARYLYFNSESEVTSEDVRSRGPSVRYANSVYSRFDHESANLASNSRTSSRATVRINWRNVAHTWNRETFMQIQQPHVRFTRHSVRRLCNTVCIALATACERLQTLANAFVEADRVQALFVRSPSCVVPWTVFQTNASKELDQQFVNDFSIILKRKEATRAKVFSLFDIQTKLIESL